MNTKIKQNRRTFKEEFKREAVNLVVSEGYSFKAAAEAVNVSENSLRNWHRKYAPEPDPSGPDGTVAEYRAEIKQYRDSYSVTMMCEVLQVSKSGYYRWPGAKPGPRARRTASIRASLKKFLNGPAASTEAVRSLKNFRRKNIWNPPAEIRLPGP